MNKSILILLVVSSFSTVFAATDRSGVLTRNEHWTREGSPYIISDDLLVPSEFMLRIDAGVQILAGRPVAFHKDIPQQDRNDSFMVSIRIKGYLKVEGKPGKPVIFSSQRGDSLGCTWYGLVLDAPSEQAELNFAEISEACNGIVVKRGRPAITGTVLAYNNVGLMVLDKTLPVAENCIFTRNSTAGIYISNANPVVRNSIIAFNTGSGIMSDKKSSLDISYNCVFGNTDRAFEGCDPRMGMPSKKVKEKYSADIFNNLISDPVFAGSVADSAAVEKDLSLSTDRSRVKNIDLLGIIHMGKTSDSLASRKRTATYTRWVLSRYSPCINAGNPAAEFSDGDGSRNDIGLYGGPGVGMAEKIPAKGPVVPVEPGEPNSPAAGVPGIHVTVKAAEHPKAVSEEKETKTVEEKKEPAAEGGHEVKKH